MEDRRICILGLSVLVSTSHGFDMEMRAYNYKFGNLYPSKLKGICNGTVLWIAFYSRHCSYKGNHNTCRKTHTEPRKILYHRDSSRWIRFARMYPCCGKHDRSTCLEPRMMRLDIRVDMHISETPGEREHTSHHLDNPSCTQWSNLGLHVQNDKNSALFHWKQNRRHYWSRRKANTRWRLILHNGPP